MQQTPSPAKPGFFVPQFLASFPLEKTIALCQYVDMECLYCGGRTKVTNSRRQSRNNQIWRRRQCLSCGAVFTTHESIELESTLSISADGKLKPFLPDLLLNDLMLALKDRQDASTAAREVIATVVNKLLAMPQKPVFSTTDISHAASEVLRRFDRRAHLRYKADHPSLQA